MAARSPDARGSAGMVTGRSLDPYVPGNSMVHAMDARSKLVCAAVFCVTVLSAPLSRLWPMALLAVFAAVVSAASSISLRALVVRLGPIAGLILLAGLGLLFQGPPVRFAAMSGKALLCGWCGALVGATTPFSDILAALRHMRVPSRIVGVTGIAYQLVFIALEEALRMATAYKCRSGQVRGMRRVRQVLRLALALCYRIIERTERMERALLARAFDGALRGLPLPPMRRRDMAASGLACAALVALLWASYA